MAKENRIAKEKMNRAVADVDEADLKRQALSKKWNKLYLFIVWVIQRPVG
jgi:hypothetical protein